MNEQEQIEGETITSLESEPVDLPKISAKPGYQTSQGQMTAVFGVVAFLMSLAGFHYSTTQVAGWYDAANNIITTLGPLIAYIPVLINYINSRGKIQSNALWASASLSSNAAFPKDIFGKILGGSGWKDPDRYINIAKIGAAAGIPKIGGIVDRLGGDSDEQDKINDGFRNDLNTLSENQNILNAKLDEVLAKLSRQG